MSEEFNGYHVWLGIPPHEQPPNHYRLLGIAMFEADLNVIDHAADRQMAHVRTFQGGRHRDLSQRILNELSAARVCLLNAEKKAAYDDDLRAKLSGALKGVPVAAGGALPVAVPVAAVVPRPVQPKAVRAPVAKPIQPAPRPVSAADDEIELEPLEPIRSAVEPLSAPFGFSTSRPLRRVGRKSIWDNPVAFASVATAAVLGLMAIWWLLQTLIALDWKELISGDVSTPPPSATKVEEATPPPRPPVPMSR